MLSAEAVQLKIPAPRKRENEGWPALSTSLGMMMQVQFSVSCFEEELEVGDLSLIHI